MDISSALESCNKIQTTLESIKPKNYINEPNYTFVSVEMLNEHSKEAFSKCFSFLKKIVNDMEQDLEKYNEKYFEDIKNRKEYVEMNFKKFIHKKEKYKKQNDLIAEIEYYEKMNLPKFENINFNRKDSLEIIKKIHNLQETSNIDNNLREIIECFVDFDLEPCSEEEIKVLEKIKNLF